MCWGYKNAMIQCMKKNAMIQCMKKNAMGRNWILIGIFFSLSFLFVGTASARILPPEGIESNAPALFTWEANDLPSDPPFAEADCSDFIYRGFLLYSTVSGKTWMPPFGLTTESLPQNFSFSCANNIAGDGCEYPLNPNYIYVVCSNKGLFDSGWSNKSNFSYSFQLNAPPVVVPPSSTSGIDTTIMSNVVASGTALIAEGVSGTFSFFSYLWPILFAIVALIVIVYLAFRILKTGKMGSVRKYKKNIDKTFAKDYGVSENEARKKREAIEKAGSDW
jgi:hypothetical protein